MIAAVIAAAILTGGGYAEARPAPLPAPLVRLERTAHPAVRCGASWYGPGFAGRRTASGTIFDPDELTAAHRTLPFGRRLEVSARGRTVVVTVTDRGPFVPGRCLDLSRAAFAELAPLGAGVLEVAVRPAD